MTFLPLHIDGWGLTSRELCWSPGGALGRIVIRYAAALALPEEEVGYLARARDGRVGLIVTGDQDIRETAYRHLHSAGWRYLGDTHTLHGTRTWWAPQETPNVR